MSESPSKNISKGPKVGNGWLIDYENERVKDEPWTHILKIVKFNKEQYTYITSKDIENAGKSWTGKADNMQPRLLAYQTSLENRPNIFKDNNLYIIPVKNGTYLLTQHNIYKELVYEDIPILNINRNPSSLILSIGNSETSTIDNVRYSGILERSEILAEPITHGPLLNGRHRCNIDITLNGEPHEIRGVQYEIDACFESQNKILTIEGKSSNKKIDSFNIRQLFFPYKTLKEQIGNKKEIICLFIHELNSIINIWKFTFENSSELNSIKQTGYYRYKLI